MSSFFLIRQPHNGKRPLQNCLLYLNFCPGLYRESCCLQQGYRQAGCRDLMAAGRSWGRRMSLGHPAAATTVSEDVYLAHCSFARGHHSQKVHDSGSGSLSPTIKSRASSSPAGFCQPLQYALHKHQSTRTSLLTAKGWQPEIHCLWRSDECLVSAWAAATCPHIPASPREPWTCRSFPAGQQLPSLT